MIVGTPPKITGEPGRVFLELGVDEPEEGPQHECHHPRRDGKEKPAWKGVIVGSAEGADRVLGEVVSTREHGDSNNYQSLSSSYSSR